MTRLSDAEIAALEAELPDDDRYDDKVRAFVERLKADREAILAENRRWRGIVNVLSDKLAAYTGKTVPDEIANAESDVAAMKAELAACRAELVEAKRDADNWRRVQFYIPSAGQE